MNRIVLVLSLSIFVYGSPISDKPVAEIKEYTNENDSNGSYFFRFVTSDGITREEPHYRTALFKRPLRLNNAGQPDEHMVVDGYYSYTDNDGNLQIVYYTADENGYSIQSPQLSTTSLSGPLVASLLGK